MPPVPFVAKCEFSKSKINAAGKKLVELPVDSPDREQVIKIVENWRACHTYPLIEVAHDLSLRAAGVSSTSLIGRRLKRLESIKLKLTNEEDMNLARMQDIGGCRAIMPSVIDVQQLLHSYVADSPVISLGFGESIEVKKVFNYLAEPKPDGYRGIHLRTLYHNPDEPGLDGRAIEIQLRSRLQHAWATTVEIYDTFSGRALKATVKTAPDEWRRFFKLMSSAIALRENLPTVEDTPSRVHLIRRELHRLNELHNFTAILSGWNTAIQAHTDERFMGSSCYILELNLDEKSLDVIGFSDEELSLANRMYTEREKAAEVNHALRVVMVSAGSMAELRDAYPNYYLNASVFLKAIGRELFELRF